MTTPSNPRFADRIDALLSSIEEAVDRMPGSVEIDTARAGNVLTLTFESDHRVVINSQEATEELWLAARSGGFHYRWKDDRWEDTRGGPTFDVALAKLVEDETGIALAY